MEVYRDIILDLFYVRLKGKKLYLKRGFTYIDARNYINNILFMKKNVWYQYYHSLSVARKQLDDVIVDADAIGGFFVLENIDSFRKIFFVEKDSGWIEALNYTFASYKNKVEIIHKELGGNDDDITVTLDTLDESGFNISFIKTSVKKGGADVLQGAKNY